MNILFKLGISILFIGLFATASYLEIKNKSKKISTLLVFFIVISVSFLYRYNYTSANFNILISIIMISMYFIIKLLIKMKN